MAVTVGIVMGLLLVGGPPAGAQVFYPDCAAAREAGVSSILRDQPGWRPNLADGNDGIACRSGRGPESTTFVPEAPAPPPPPPGSLPEGTVPGTLVLIVLGAVVAVLLDRRLRTRA